MDGIANVDRGAEFHFESAKSQHSSFEYSQLISLSDGIAGGQHSVGDALAHERRLAVFGVGVHGVKVAGEGGELHQVGFGDGAAAGSHFDADFKLFKIQTARAV